MTIKKLKPLLMMRTKGLLGVIGSKYKNVPQKSKSSGTQVKLGIVP